MGLCPMIYIGSNQHKINEELNKKLKKNQLKQKKLSTTKYLKRWKNENRNKINIIIINKTKTVIKKAKNVINLC